MPATEGVITYREAGTSLVRFGLTPPPAALVGGGNRAILHLVFRPIAHGFFGFFRIWKYRYPPNSKISGTVEPGLRLQ